MADISLQYAGAEQAIDDMRNAGQRITSALDELQQELAPFAQQFVGQAASEYHAFQSRVSQLESAMQSSLTQGSQILAGIIQGHRDSDVQAAGQFS
jgi:WXG100 family type VII secretion target